MLPGSNFLSLGGFNLSPQATDNSKSLAEETDLHGSFAALMQMPYESASAALATAGGEALPQDGSELPASLAASATEDRLPVWPAELGTVPEGAASMLPGESAKLAGLPLRQAESPPTAAGETLLTVDDDPRLVTPPGERSPAAQTSLRSLSAEDDASVYVERHGARVMALAERRQLQPAASAEVSLADVAEPDGDDLATLKRLQTMASPQFESQQAAPRPVANSQPSASPIAAMPMQVATTAEQNGDSPGKSTISISASSSPTIVVDGLQSPQALTAQPTRATPLPSFSIDVPVQDDGFGEALQDRVMWMAGRRIHSAELRLNPAELGPIRVQISVEDDAAKLTFSAQHSVTREAIEQAMPRLREMLSENGLSLAGSTVHDGDADGTDKGRHAGEDQELESQIAGEQDDDIDAAVSVVRQKESSSLVDTFA